MPSNSKKMAKGTKRKIEIKKRDTKEQRAVTCSKRRPTLFSKAADLCLVSGANIAIFVTPPSENSDVVYSFSGYSPASEIAHCYLNGKLPPKFTTNPQPKLGFWWEDPDLYRSCDDLSELNMIQDRLEKTKKDLIACLEEKEKPLFVSNFDRNPSNNSLDVSCSQNPSSEDCVRSSVSQFVSDFDQPSSPYMVSIEFDQNPSSSLHEIYGEPCSQIATFDPNPSSSVVEPCSQVTTFDDPNPSSSVQENYSESFYNDHVLVGLNNGFCLSANNPQVNITNEEDDYMVNVEELFSEEDMRLLGFCES